MNKLLCCFAALVCFGEGLVAEDRPPNIVLIYADDLGWGDLGCYGHPTIRTPNLDRIASAGARFTQFYSAAEVCSPSRAALMTGRYPIRSGICHDQFRVLRNNSAGGLPKSELTIAELLKQKGYATGCIGKWHLGHLPEHLPPNHGFDEYFGMPYSNDMLPAADAPKGREKFFAENTSYWKTPLIRGKEIIDPHPDQTKLTHAYTDEAVQFVRRHKDHPFFLYFPHNFPHVPLFASPAFRGKSRAGLYGDVVEEIDASVGRVLDAIRDSGIEKDTLVIFSSDNGPWLIFNEHGGSAGPLREGKGSTWEGGMRVPGIFYWPSKIEPGVRHEMATTMDVLPTVAKLTGAALPQDRVLDGIDISSLLVGHNTSDPKAIKEREPFFYYRGATLYAVRKGPWKAHWITKSAYGNDKAVVHETPELYQLEIDPSEKFDVAKKFPEQIDGLKLAVQRHRASLTEVPSQLVETVPSP